MSSYVGQAKQGLRLQGLCQDVLSEMPKEHNNFWGEGQVSDYLVVDMKGSSVLT